MHESSIYGHDPVRLARVLIDKAKERKLPLTPLQVIKLVYLAHGWMLGLRSRPMINQPVEAWKYGPVIPSVYQAVRKYGSQHVQDIPVEPAELDAEEEQTLNEVLELYGNKHGLTLSRITHEDGTPWDQTYRWYKHNPVIPTDMIEAHFRDLYRKLSDAEASRGEKEVAGG